MSSRPTAIDSWPKGSDQPEEDQRVGDMTDADYAVGQHEPKRAGVERPAFSDGPAGVVEISPDAGIGVGRSHRDLIEFDPVTPDFDAAQHKTRQMKTDN